MSATTTGTEVELKAVSGDAASAARGLEFGGELVRFAESVAAGDPARIRQAREALLEVAGPAVLVDAAGVAANFQRMVRIADSIGIPVDRLDSGLSRQIRADLQLDRFASARNTPGVNSGDARGV